MARARTSSTAEAATPARARRPRGIQIERSRFKSLLLQNPNYFGNLALSPFKPIKVIKGNTSFEEMVCVGLNPPYDRLEAVLRVKQNAGYGGDICSGSSEYVRFYVDVFDNGVWHDVGVASVKVYDLPGDKPVCYAVPRDFSSFRKFCLFENIIKVRAILQWNVPPPANTPGYVPVWGNVVDVQVQVHPRKFLPWGELLEQIEQIPIKFPDPIGPVIKGLDPAVKLTAAEVQPLTVLQKKELYKKAKVPVHRFAFQEVQQLLSLSEPAALTAQASPRSSSWAWRPSKSTT